VRTPPRTTPCAMRSKRATSPHLASLGGCVAELSGNRYTRAFSSSGNRILALASCGDCGFLSRKPASTDTHRMMPQVHALDSSDLPTLTADSLTNARSLDFVRLVACLADMSNQHASGFGTKSLSDEFCLIQASEEFVARWPRSLNAALVTKATQYDLVHKAYMQKAAVNPGTTLEPSWASPLALVRPLIEAFIDVARPQSLVGKLTDFAARVPFNVTVPVASSGGTYRWVGQGAPKPVGNMSLASNALPILKAAGLIVVTKELLKLTGPASAVTLRREMIRGMSAYLDQQLTDPTVAAVSGVSPASITNVAPSIGSAGASAATVGSVNC
jgi:hypothetical protein